LRSRAGALRIGMTWVGAWKPQPCAGMDIATRSAGDGAAHIATAVRPASLASQLSHALAGWTT
jgi:hypothetical protein